MRDRLATSIGRVPSWVRTLVAFAAFAGVATWLTISTWHNIRDNPLGGGPLTDFRDAIYYPLVALRDGVNPYDVHAYLGHYPVGQEFPVYTPLHLVLHSPLLLFSFGTARALSFAWNVALALGYAMVVLRLIGARLAPASVFGLGALVMVSDPGKFDLRTGQPTLIIVIAVLVALRAVASPRDPKVDAAGPSPPVSFLLGCLSLALVWSKPTYAIPIVVLLVARGRARLAMVGTAAAVAGSALVLPRLVDAAGGVGPLVDSWWGSILYTSRSAQSRLGSGLRIDAASALVRLTHAHESEGVAVVAGLVMLVAGAWLVGQLHRRDPAGDREELTLTIVCLLMIITTYHVAYDYILLIPPMAMLLRPRPTHPIAWPRYVRRTVALMLLAPIVSPLGWSPVNAALGTSDVRWALSSSLMSVYVLVALGLCVWTAQRQLRGASVTPLVTPLVTPSVTMVET
jgi:hypothetical protein